jgi:hypothetical protein
MTTLKRQFITDATGNPIGVILPMEEFVLIEQTLEQRLQSSHAAHSLALMEQAAHDPLFLADLHETMGAWRID